MSLGAPRARTLGRVALRNLVHIHQTAELAERVLLPGDPGRALRLAQALLEQPRMLNHNRGLWGYTGTARDGAALSIQSTGMGGPSAAVVASELIELGARLLVRVGTCGALQDGLQPGGLVVVSEAIADDGTSVALGAGRPLCRVTAPGGLRDQLVRAGAARGAAALAVVSSDLFYDVDAERVARWRAAGAVAVEMETAALFALAARRGVQAASALLCSNVVGEERYLAPEALHAGEIALGELALAALAP